MKRRQKSKHSPSQEIKHVAHTIHSMRGLVEAARVPSTRRLITPAKAMARINELTKKELSYVRQVRDDKRRSLEAPGSQVPGRNAPDKRELLRETLSSQVRQFHRDARRALVCQSRATRREVLFALQKTGKNGHGNRKAVWTALSHLSCKKRG